MQVARDAALVDRSAHDGTAAQESMGVQAEGSVIDISAATNGDLGEAAVRLDSIGGKKPNGNAPVSWRDHCITAAKLQRETFPPVSYVIPDLIPEGLSILAGRPKIGKSWLALEVAIAVAAGRICLGDRKASVGDVLYAALEDNPRRLQRRIDKMLSPVSADWPERLSLATEWRRLDKGGVEDVAGWAKSVTKPLPAKAGTAIDTLVWLIERYRETTAWLDLSLATRRNRENHFKHVIRTAGHFPYRKIDQAAIVAGRDRRATTPAQARNFLDATRGLFKWAKAAGHVAVDPTEGIDYPKRRKAAGFPVWTEEEVERYCVRWPVGTKERVWIDVLLFTGLRRGDAVKLGRQHVR
jgi:hypothetical protein